jgi:hypothetical protein
MKKVFKNAFLVTTYCFAACGVFFLGSFALSKLHLTNVKGSIDSKTAFIKSSALRSVSPDAPKIELGNNLSLAEIKDSISKLSELRLYKMKNFCRLQTLNQIAGDNAKDILAAYRQSNSDALIAKMTDPALLKLSNDSSVSSDISRCDTINTDTSMTDLSVEGFLESNSYNVYPWSQDDTWAVLSEALAKDKGVLMEAATMAGVEPRMVISTTFAEQTRMFRTQRGLFKKYLEPLKVLASANQFSLGVMGIKQKTAEEIEQHLTDQSSPYYLGPQYEHLLDFKTNNVSTERYDRLSNQKDHYYSYLYGALFIKQIQKQWSAAGYPIENHPEIIGTLFNIGFQHSTPNADPQVGGAVININDEDYTFGSLVYEFYYSGKLLSDFPYIQESKAIHIR